MRNSAAHLLFLPLLMLGASSGHAQGRYTQATYITASQFLVELKEVSLDLRTDSSLTRIVPVTEQQSDVARALAVRGITVHPNSPVILEVRMTHTRDTIQSVNRDTGGIDETTVVQGIYVGMRFLVRAAAWRHGKLHWVYAAPAVAQHRAEHLDLEPGKRPDHPVIAERGRGAVGQIVGADTGGTGSVELNWARGDS